MLKGQGTLFKRAVFR